MFYAVMVGCESVLNSPQHGLRATADVDLAVDRADVGLHGVWAQIRQRGNLGIALALGDERQNLSLSIAEPFAAAGPVKSNRAACPRRSIADNRFACVYCLQRLDQLPRR